MPVAAGINFAVPHESDAHLIGQPPREASPLPWPTIKGNFRVSMVVY